MADAATRTIDVEVEPEKLYDVITEFESYPEFLGGLGLVGVEVESRGDDEMVVTQRVKKLGKTVSYTLKYKLDRPHEVTWTFVRGQMMSHNTGSWTLEKTGEGKTRATYAIEVKFGMLVPKSLVKLMVSKELPQMLEAFKKRAESRSS